MTKFIRAFALVGASLAALASTPAAASNVIAIGAGSFYPSDTTISFTGVSNGAQVGNYFSGNGVTFTGALYGMTNSGDTNLFPSNGGGTIASNWVYNSSNGLQGLTFQALFSTAATRVGFFLENHTNQTMTVNLYSGSLNVGSLALAQTSSLNAEFRGIFSQTAFDRAVFTNTANTNGFFAIDDFTFNANPGAVPEPATWAMMIGGFGMVGGAMRSARRKQKVSVTFA